MKIICDKNRLLEAINTVQKSVPSKSTIPILEGILIETVDNKLRLTGTNLEISIEYKLEADIQEQGKIILNSKTFGEIVRKLPNAPVLIEKSETNEIVIKCGNSKFKINCSNPDGFPETQSITSVFEYTLKQGTLKDMIRQTMFAISLDEKNKILNGSLFEFDTNKFSIISIDGFRMAIRLNKNESKNEFYKMIVPGKTLNEVVKVFTNIDEDVTILSSGKQVVFKTENCILFSKLIGGDYLNYNTFIPKDIETILKINTSNILSSVERASIIANEDRKYPVKFEISDDKLVISSHTDIGEVRDELFPEIEGNDITISFNPRYFLEALKNIEDEEIKIQFTTNIGPSIIRPVEQEKFTYMILPVRT